MADKLNAIEQAKLSRQIAQTQDRIRRLEQLLQGQPLAVIRFIDASITSAKIEGLSADKLTSGTMSVGEKILISDGTDNRILITRDEIRISKPGVDVEEEITEENIKDFIILNTTEADKLVFAGIVKANAYTHNLGYVPWFRVFDMDDADSPTFFKRRILGIEADEVEVSGFQNPSYVMIFHRTIPVEAS
jgi:hypothetical protein